MKTCQKYSRNERRKVKENDAGGEFNYDML
jgi:hypothetical protein